MRLISLELTDYRGIAHERFTFPEGNCAVLFGMNGAGKTTILDAVAAMMVPYVNTLCSLPAEAEETAITGETKNGFEEEEEEEPEGSVLKNSDIRIGAASASCSVSVTFSDNDPSGVNAVTWRAVREKFGLRDRMTLDFDVALAVAQVYRDWVIEDIRAGNSSHNIPIVVYYPTERTIIDIPLRIRKRHDFSHQLAALEGALHRKSQDFKVFFEWFREREDLENEIVRRENPFYQDRELDAVRRAIPAMLEGYGDLHIKRNPLRMEVRKLDQMLQVNQLSHGEKCVLALFGDLARRLAIANPTLPDPLTGQAVVLIDEVELHLHPDWQRKIVNALTKTFPNCQFLLSTHSPQVLSEIPNAQIFLMNQGRQGETQLISGLPLFGRDSNQILADIMNVPERPLHVRDQIREVFDLIAYGDLEEAARKVKTLEVYIGADEPALIRIRTLLAAKRKD